MRRKSVPTIRDVAREANVSTATVSHVFNNTRWVSPSTRQAVLDAAARLNYRPSAIARSLTTRRTHAIGVVVADVLNPFFSSIIRGVEDGLWRQGHSLIVCSTDEQPDKEAYYLRLLLERRVDGILIAPTGADQPIFDEIQYHHIPMVFIDRRPSEPYGPMIETDNVQAGYLATRYLLQLGHRRIAILARRPSLSTVVSRVQGYKQALAEFQLANEAAMVVTVNPRQEAAFQATCRLLQDDDAPTALIATNHIMTLGVLTALKTAKIRCPEDVSIVAFDDLPWLELLAPPLTAIRHPIAELCSIAVEMLLKAVDESSGEGQESATAAFPTVMLPPILIERGSCRPL